MGIQAYISIDDYDAVNPVSNRSSRVFDDWMPDILPPLIDLFFFISDGVITDDGTVIPPPPSLTFNLSDAVLSDGTVDPIVLPVITVNVTFA